MTDEPDLAIHIECPTWLESLPRAEEICRAAALATLAKSARPAEVSIVLADDDFLRCHNKDFRGLDEVTNVLAFGGLEGPASGPVMGPVMGDVMIAHGRARAECDTDPLIASLGDHLSHLVVHGLLHLLGHDHDTKGEAGAMESLEIEILAGLGVADPYGPELVPAGEGT